MSSRSLRLIAAGGALVLALTATGCSAGSSSSYTPPDQVDAELPKGVVENLQTAVDDAMEAAGASGAIVGVWVPWSGTWVTGVGDQGGEDGGEVTKDMSFRIGDVTRMMTCDVMYALADEGTIDLSEPVTTYTSGVADLKDVTLVDLCNSSSGIGSSQSTVKESWLRTPEREWGPLQMASYGLDKKSGKPGEKFRNSDAGYLVLGRALERATGKSAADLINEYVTRPLGLDHTSLPDPTPAAPSPDPALKGYYSPKVKGGYDCSVQKDITVMSSSAGFTDSGVVSTIDDLGRYIQASAREALRAENAKPARYGSPLPATKNAPSWYQATGGAFLVGPLIGQQGWTPGYSTAAFADPETGLTVAITLNNSSASSTIAQHTARELAAIASKAPAAKGQEAPEFGLPFTAEKYADLVSDKAICVAPSDDD